MDNEIKPSEFEAAFEAGKNSTFSTEVNGIQVFGMPRDMKIETLEHLQNKMRAKPYRLAQKIKLLSAESFIEYFNRFSNDESTIFVDVENSKFTAVIDYHDSKSVEGQKWCEHVIHYNCPKTKEWNSWEANDNEKMSQEDFALFLEDNLREIIEPNGADLLEIVSTLKAKKGLDFKSSIRLDNGEIQFNYQETIDGQAGVNGQFSIPEQFKLALKPFLSGAPYEMTARFRYRITPSGLVMWYTLVRPHAVKQDAVNEVIELINSKIERGQLIEADVNF